MTSSNRPSKPLTVLLLGATGYIGASVLGRLIHQPDTNRTYEIICYLRNEKKAQQLLEQSHLRSVIGTLEDADKLEDAVAGVDIVINTADADHLPSAQAILRGLKRKFVDSGKPPLYIHTSGTGVLSDDAGGAPGNPVTYDDTNVAQLRSIPDSTPHRNIDLAVLAADEEGYVKTYLILPPVVYGLASGPLFDANLANRHSVMLPSTIGVAIERGRAGMVGEGRNVWPHVHISDMADLYRVVFNHLVSDSQPQPGHGWEGFYFAENRSFMFRDVSLAIGLALEKVGKVKHAIPTSYTKEEIDKFFGGAVYFGSNSICTSKRARALGWTPKYTTEDFFASIAPEVDAMASSGQLVGQKLLSQLALIESARASSNLS